jgi:hypothetical protein
MKATSRSKTKSKAKPKPATRHRGDHPNEIDINLHSEREDVKELLAKLNPILGELLRILRKKPLEFEHEDGCEGTTGGYHNITYCEH